MLTKFFNDTKDNRKTVPATRSSKGSSCSLLLPLCENYVLDHVGDFFLDALGGLLAERAGKAFARFRNSWGALKKGDRKLDLNASRKAESDSASADPENFDLDCYRRLVQGEDHWALIPRHEDLQVLWLALVDRFHWLGPLLPVLVAQRRAR